MGDRVIPNNIIALPKNPSGQSPPAQANSVAKSSTQQQVVGAGRDSVIPILYGGPERMAGLLYIARIFQSKLLLCLLLCEGPVEEIGVGQLNDDTIPSGITINKYLGTSAQNVDPLLAAAIAGFTETMRGTAYVVILLPASVSTGFPQFTFLVKGRKVYDVRDGTQDPADPSTWKWSDNPALCLGDFLSSQTYGARKDVDWTSVSDAADFCDEMVTGVGGTEKRALITLAIAEKRAVKQWIDALRAYVPAWVDYDGATAMVIADMPRSSDFTFDENSIDTEVQPVLSKRGVKDTPNVIQIGYMRTDLTPWAMDYAEAVAGSPAVRRVSRTDLPGIRRYSQAVRFATESLNHYTLEDLEGQMGVFEAGIKVFLGDRATITDDIGLDAKEARITARQDRGFGRWLLGWREYDPAAYSDTVEVTPSSADTGRPDPKVVQPATGLAIVETVYLEKDLAADSIKRGLVYLSRFDVSWVASTHAYPVTYSVQFLDGTTLVHEGTTAGTTYASPAVQQGKTYTVNVTAVNSLGFESSAIGGSLEAKGKLLPPGDVPEITKALELGGNVIFEIAPAVDIDIIGYEWRRGTVGAFSWDTAIPVGQQDSLNFYFPGLPEGPWTFGVKAVDSVGQRSANALTVDLTVTRDSRAFLQDHEFTSPTLTNMVSIPPLEGVWKSRWATAVGSDVFTSVEPNPFNSGGNPVISYHASASSKFQGESWDIGTIVSGTWQLYADVTAVSGSSILEIEHSNDGSSWTTESGTTWQGSARYVRPVVRSTTTSTLRLNAPPRMSLAAVTHSENGSATSSAVAATTISLTGKYTSDTSIVITPRGTAARNYAVNNVVLSPTGANSFDVYLFNASGTQVASTFSWTFEGF